jgi:hypothetical protein
MINGLFEEFLEFSQQVNGLSFAIVIHREKRTPIGNYRIGTYQQNVGTLEEVAGRVDHHPEGLCSHALRKRNGWAPILLFCH